MNFLAFFGRREERWLLDTEGARDRLGIILVMRENEIYDLTFVLQYLCYIVSWGKCIYFQI